MEKFSRFSRDFRDQGHENFQRWRADHQRTGVGGPSAPGVVGYIVGLCVGFVVVLDTVVDVLVVAGVVEVVVVVVVVVVDVVDVVVVTDFAVNQG